MNLNLQNGVQIVPAGGTSVARGGRGSDLLVSQLRGKYYQTNADGNLFSVANQAAVTTTAALATTFTGLAVGNPVGSGVNLAIKSFIASQFAVGAAGAVGIMGGSGSITASLTPISRQIGSGTLSRTNATAGQTISTPLLIATYGSIGSLATTGYGLVNSIQPEIDGAIIVPPGSFIASYTTIVTTSALIFGFVWEEVPI